MREIYLDNQATTPMDPRVRDGMRAFQDVEFGNASSPHAAGIRAREAVENSRAAVAGLIGAEPREIVFTSGATEANNIAILGFARRFPNCHVVTCASEHKAVLEPCIQIQREGGTLTILSPDRDGLLSPEKVAAAIRPETRLVSLMVANNEIGAIHPIAEISSLLRANNADVIFHTDAAQAVGKLPINVCELGVDALSLSGHKLYGPKGVGVLWLRRGVVGPEPLQYGGGQEQGLRPGTYNVPAIVGLGLACKIAQDAVERGEAEICCELANELTAGLQEAIGAVRVNGPAANRLAGNLNLMLEGVEAEALIANLRSVCVSSGSACTAATLEPSHVLRAIGLSDDAARCSIRISVGRFNSRADIQEAIHRIAAAVNRIRRLDGQATGAGRL